MTPEFWLLWPEFAESTAPFAKLYGQVTAQLRLRQQALPAAVEREWIDYLIQGFDREFKAWEYKPRLRPYLDLTGESCGASPALRVIGHAYLHICYDLPRVLANSLNAIPIDRWRAQAIYRQLGPDFAAVYKHAISDAAIFGGYAKLWNAASKILSKRKAAAVTGLLGNWLFTRRTEAWINAAILRESPDRHHLDSWLLREIERAARAVMELTSDPIEWLNRLDSPILPGPYITPFAEVIHAGLIPRATR